MSPLHNLKLLLLLLFLNNRGVLNFTNQFSLGRLGKISQEQARVDQQYCMSSVSPNLAWKSDREKRRSFYVRYFSGEHVAELLGMGLSLRQRDEQMMDWMDGWMDGAIYVHYINGSISRTGLILDTSTYMPDRTTTNRLCPFFRVRWTTEQHHQQQN